MTLRPRILVVEDDPVSLKILAEFLSRDGLEIRTLSSGEEAVKKIQEETFDLILSDIQLDGADGFRVLKAAQAASPDTPVILMTAYAGTDSVLQALRGGACDYITKPFVPEEIRLTLKRALELSKLRAQNLQLRRTLHETYNFPNFWGDSPTMKKVFTVMEKVIPLDCHVLITGESGTGKELVAKAIHFSGPRAGRPYVAVNCGAMPENLLESELFGHVRGAFTDARTDKKGLVAVAEGGSLLLDEIAEMSPGLQVKLLRLLQEKEFRPVGGTSTLPSEARVLAATNKDLRNEVKAGRFREDLYFRLNVVEIRIPPLRERRDDIAFLARSFLSRFRERHGRPVEKISPEAVRLLMSHEWPGNVRELENAIERAVIFCDDDTLKPSDLKAVLDARAGSLADQALAGRLSLAAYARTVYTTLKDKYSLGEIAKILGISRKSLWERRKRWEGGAAPPEEMEEPSPDESSRTPAA